MMRLILFVSVFVAVLPATVYLIAVRWQGRLEREPLRLLLLMMAWGAIGGTTIGLVMAHFIEDVMMIYDPRLTALGLTDFALYVPLAEEVAKGIALIALASTPRISHTTSGLIYGMAVGLGFAITENIVYCLRVYQMTGWDAWVSTVCVRTLFSATVHSICSGILGFALGWSKIRVPGEQRIVLGIVLGLLMAVALHGNWNAAIFVSNITGNPLFSVTAFVSTPWLVLIMLVLTWRSLQAERRIILRELTEESSAGVIPASYVVHVASPQWRLQKDWLPAHVDATRYISLACELAIRRRIKAPESELNRLRAALKKTLHG